MPLFFNGRLWETPATMSVVDDSRMYNKNLSVGNVLAIIGRSEGGEPLKALAFGSIPEARRALRGGPLLQAIEKAFDPSSETFGPSMVIGVRINPATKSFADLLTADGTPCIALESTDYGLYTGAIRSKIEAGSLSGRKLTTQQGNGYFTADNIERAAFTIQYSGAEDTATITVTDGAVKLYAPAGSLAADIDLTAFVTIQEVVDRINSTSGFYAAVGDRSAEKPALQGLDHVTDQDVKTAPFTVRADLQAVVDWFNSVQEGFITAKRYPNVGKPPAYTNWVGLTGGSDGNVTMAEWQSAYDALQSEDVQWVVPLSPAPAIHAMNDTHCAYMSNIARMERRGIVGTASGSSDDEALEAVKALNSDRSSLVHLGYYDYDARGRLQLFEPYMKAAVIAGAFSGVNPGTALTNKSLKIRGIERKLRNPTDTDKLIRGGVLCVEDTTGRGYRVVKSITTWLNNNNYNRVEISVGVALDFVARNVRNALDPLRGAKGNPTTMALAYSRTETTLIELARPEPGGPGVIVGDDLNPAYRNITVSLDGDVLRVEFECSPVIPINYIPVVIYAVPYSGQLTSV